MKSCLLMGLLVTGLLVIGLLVIGLVPSNAHGVVCLVDRDADGTADPDDNCPEILNRDQADADENGIGDVCQCGDVDGDGLTNSVDALRIARGEVPSTGPGFLHCDVDGDGSCNTVDALKIARGEVSSGPLDQHCPAYRGASTTPALLSSQPEPGALGFPRTGWVRLKFEGVVSPTALESLRLRCGGIDLEVARHLLSPQVALVNPDGELPADSSCELRFEGPLGTEVLAFSTAGAGAPATVLYDRDSTRMAPFPDDVWLTEDPNTPTGRRLAVPLPPLPPDELDLVAALLTEANELDGFSPIAHFVIELSEAADPATLPRTVAESLDPLAAVGLFELDPESPAFGKRIPFRLDARSDTNVLGMTSHTLLLFPGIPLEPRGRYGLVVTRRALVSVSRPLYPSAFFLAAQGPPEVGESATLRRARELSAEVLDVVACSSPPIPADDVALALRISVRSTEAIPSDLLSMREQVFSGPPPAVEITSVEADADPDVAAIVRGTWEAPEWRQGSNLMRDAAGEPVRFGSQTLPFILALPTDALSGPVPVTMYQHGTPGSAEAEVPFQARSHLAAAGFAVIGFRDPLNREVLDGVTDLETAGLLQVVAFLGALLDNWRLPDFNVEANAEQLAFVRAIQSLESLDVLPIGAPDGSPELDLAAPLTYLGISQGAVHGQALLAYAPEIRAAALVAGGSRLVEGFIHQAGDQLVPNLGILFPNLTAAQVWVGTSLFQTDFDRQDSHNHAAFIYRDPLEVSGTAQKASTLVLEGLGDSFVPNSSTESLAWAIGPIPHLEPRQRIVPFLESALPPVAGNIDAETTAGLYQYVPADFPGIPATPGCSSEPEGHFCPQIAPESFVQRIHFFQTALTDSAPSIIDPLGP